MAAEQRSWSGAGLALVGLATTAGLLAVDANIRETLLPLTSHLRVAALVLTVVFAASSHWLWRVTGEVRGCRVATAGWLLAGVVAIDLGAPDAGSAAWSLRAALAAVCAGWLLWAAAGPDVDTVVRPWRDLTLAVVVTIGVWGVLALLAAASTPNAATGVSLVRTLGVAWWTATAVGIVLRSTGARSYLLGWVQWAVAGIAVAELVNYLEVTGAVELAFPSATIRLGALLLAAIGTVTSLAAAATGRRGELYRELQRHQRTEEARRSEEAERDHDLRNALLAIEGATLTLQRHRDHLSPEIQEELTSTVVHQLAELREMMVPHARTDEATTDQGGARDDGPRVLGGPASTGAGNGSCAPRNLPSFRLTEVVRDQVGLARARDLSVELQLAGALSTTVRGDRAAIARVVDNLIRNAEVHGAGDLGSRIDVEVRNDGEHLVLSVRDHGLGVPIGEEESIFRRGVRLSSTVDGEGLGLHIARRTMRELGGDLRCEHPAGGGARFVASFPPATPDDDGGGRDAERPGVGRHGPGE